jgi:hypothetical protein
MERRNEGRGKEKRENGEEKWGIGNKWREEEKEEKGGGVVKRKEEKWGGQ